MRPSAESSRRLLSGLGCLFFLLPIVGTWTTHGVPPVVKGLSTFVLIVTALRPHWGLWTMAVLLPLNPLLRAYLSPEYNAATLAEMLLAPFVFAATIRLACGMKAPASRLAGPALVLGAIIAASGILGMAARQLATTWPLDYARGLWMHLIDEYYDQSAPYIAFHSAAPWIEGLTLAVLAERLLRAPSAASAWLIGPVALAAAERWKRLVDISLRGPNREHPIASAIGFLQTVRGGTLFADANAGGSMLALFFVPAAWMALSSALAKDRNLLRIAGYLVATVVIGLMLYWTHSRTAWVGVPVALIVIWIYSRRPSWRVFAAITCGAMALLAASMMLGPAVETQSSSTVAVGLRLEMGKIALRIAGEHPVFGVGIGGFQVTSRRFVSEELLKTFPATAVGENAHNNFLQVLAELGITGFGAFLWLLGAAAMSVRGASDPGAPRHAQVALGGGVLAFLFSCLGGHPFLTIEILWMFLLTLGVMTALGNPPIRNDASYTRWIAVTLTLIVVASVPVRVWQLRHDESRRRIVGAGPPTDLDSDRVYRPAGPRSSWPVPSQARSVEIPLRITRDSSPPCLVRLALDGKPANIVDVRADAWTPLLLQFEPLPAGKLSRLVELTLDSPSCHLMVGTFTIRE